MKNRLAIPVVFDIVVVGVRLFNSKRRTKMTTAKSNTINKTGRRSLDEVARHPGTVDLYGESGSYWLHLEGYYSPYMECHTIHEPTIAKLKEVFRGIKPCTDKEFPCPCCAP
jgi:hypothetical protein